jgi:hypothetical protein
VTPSGQSTDLLELTANQTALPLDQLSVANVTIATSDPSIDPESLRVGFWRLSANPVAIDVPIADNSRALATNPVEPYAYHAVTDSGVINVYNVYTGALVTQFTGAVTSVDALATSSDGRLLFVTNADNGRTYALNAANGSLVATYPQSSGNFSDPMALVYTEPNGHAVLWTPFEQVIDVEARSALPLTRDGNPLFRGWQPVRRATTPDGLELYETSTIATTSDVDRFSQEFFNLDGRALEFAQINGAVSGGGQSGWDMCVPGRGSTLVTLGPPRRWSVSPTAVNNPTDLTIPASLTSTAVACSWDGRIFVALGTSSSPQNNLYVFSENGASVAPPALNGPNNASRYSRKLRVSGDARRVIGAVQVSGTAYLSFSDAP